MTDCSVISLKTVAKLIGASRTQATRYVRSLNIVPQMRRTPDAGNSHACLTVTQEECDFIVKNRKDDGFLESSQSSDNIVGQFYILQVIPEFCAWRVKLGYADNVQSRITHHKTSAPSAQLLKTWPCERFWEKTVIDHALRCDHDKIGVEVFEFHDLDALVVRLDVLFTALGAQPND